MKNNSENPPQTWSWNLVGNVLLVDNYIDNGASCLKPIDVKVDTEDRLSELSKNVEWTNKVQLVKILWDLLYLGKRNWK